MKKINYILFFVIIASKSLSCYGQDIIIKDARKASLTPVALSELRSAESSDRLAAVLSAPDTTKNMLSGAKILLTNDAAKCSELSDTLRITVKMLRWRKENVVNK
jgi:hypothetical protein